MTVQQLANLANLLYSLCISSDATCHVKLEGDPTVPDEFTICQPEHIFNFFLHGLTSLHCGWTKKSRRER